MTGDTGNRVIQDFTIPVAPVFTRLDDDVTRGSVAGAVGFVAPYFAGVVAAPVENVSGPASVVEADVPVKEALPDLPSFEAEPEPIEIGAPVAEGTEAEPVAAEVEARTDAEPSVIEAEPEAPAWAELSGTGLEMVTPDAELRPTAPVSPVAYELAARLEAIAQRLRTDGTAAVVAGMRGDRLDALLAGVFAGYLAAREADSRDGR